MPLTINMDNESKCIGIKVSAKTTGGNPAQFQPGSLTVVIVDGNPNVTYMVTGDDTYDVVSGDGAAGLGTSTLRVSVDADLGDGVVELADLTQVNVSGAIGTILEQGVGTIVPK